MVYTVSVDRCNKRLREDLNLASVSVRTMPHPPFISLCTWFVTQYSFTLKATGVDCNPFVFFYFFTSSHTYIIFQKSGNLKNEKAEFLKEKGKKTRTAPPAFFLCLIWSVSPSLLFVCFFLLFLLLCNCLCLIKSIISNVCFSVVVV